MLVINQVYSSLYELPLGTGYVKGATIAENRWSETFCTPPPPALKTAENFSLPPPPFTVWKAFAPPLSMIKTSSAYVPLNLPPPYKKN